MQENVNITLLIFWQTKAKKREEIMKTQQPSYWGVFKSNLERISAGITGQSFQIVDIRPEENELGYTQKGNRIHLAYSHPLMDSLDEPHKMMFIKGVFGHELMHQLNTDFDAVYRQANRLPKLEAKIFMDIFNIMEDPAIEFWASSFFGGHLLRAVHFMTMHLYKEAFPLEKSSTPFTQFVNAYIQYGDGGLLVGKFTFPQAEESFFKALPLFDKAIEEPSGTKRIRYAKQVFDLTKPLWVEELKDAEAFERMMQEIEKMLENIGKNTNGNGGSPSGKTPESKDNSSESSDIDSASQKKQARRMKTAQKVKRELSERADVKQGKSGLDNSSETDGHGNPQKNSTDASFESSEKDLHDKDDSEKIDPLEFELSEKDVRLLLDEIALCKVDAESENLENDKTNQVDNSSDEICKKYPSATCYNTTLSADLSGCDNDYQAIIEEIQGGITHLAKQFERMFRNNRGDTVYRESGRISPKRLIRGTKTSRVFTKRIDPKNKGNIAVELVVDVSGSMSCGNRMSVARKAVIGLAEVFEKVHIPCKVLAFTADKKGYTAYHYHILNWHNNRASRKQLLLLHPQNNNFDGFSIRCAGAEIAKRPEQHKLIIVISDGQPICHSYSSVSNGVADTTRAIQEASKNATVIGVAIAADIDVLHSMYGRNFVYVEHIDDMFDQIGQVIKKEVASW